MERQGRSIRLTAVLRFSVALGSLVLVASACGTQSAPDGEGISTRPGQEAAGSPTATATATAGPVMSGTEVASPPPFRLRYDGRELALLPHTWCYRNGCVDGFSADPPSVGGPGVIHVQVPVENWDLSATFTPVNQRCGRQQSVEPTKDAGWYVLHPTGPAGSYDVDLFAQGTGDMVARFRWATPRDGEQPVPEASLALIADDDGQPDSYGVELTLANLAETPQSAQAQIEVAARNGDSLTFDTNRADEHCLPEGTVHFDGPDAQGAAAAALGDMPFHYTVTVTMDGTAYRASADYPADEIGGNEPFVSLEFSPPLPALP